MTHVLSARGEYSAEDSERIQRVAQLFGIEAQPSAAAKPVRRHRVHGEAA